MPRDRSRRSRLFRCERAARRRWFWWYSIVSATFLSRRVRSRGDISGSSCASTANRTWWALHHRFFFPKPSGLPGQEQQAHHAQDQMAHQGKIAADLEVVKAHLHLGVPVDLLDVAAAESQMQKKARVGVFGRVGQEVFDLALQDVARHDQPSRRRLDRSWRSRRQEGGRPDGRAVLPQSGRRIARRPVLDPERR